MAFIKTIFTRESNGDWLGRECIVPDFQRVINLVDLGIFTDVSPVLRNAALPIDLTEGGIFTEVSPVQP